MRVAAINHQRPSAGFTLVELLIVVALLLIMATLTVAAFNSTANSDRIRSASRQMQSALLGARDRAIHAKVPRGLRLVRQEPGSELVNSMVYIGAENNWQEGSVTIQLPTFPISSPGYIGSNSEPIIVVGTSTNWKLLLDQGLIGDGARIEIPRDSGDWYTVNLEFLRTPPTGASSNQEFLLLSRNGYRKPITGDSLFYQLELNPAVLPGQEPLQLPSGTVANLARSKKPGGWAGSTNLDILFTPRGWALDSAAVALSSTGLIHLYICSQEDGDLNLDPANPKSGDKYILTFHPRTGNVASYDVDVTDANNDGVADDPFRYAKLGGTAGR